MIFETDFSLKPFNTFGIDALAKQFVAVHSKEELASVLQNHKDIFILGGGSNMLLTKNIDKLVVHVDLKGIEIVDTNDDFVWVKAQAGENWHQFVLYCIEKNYGGLENLSLIPVLGLLSCLYMMCELGISNWIGFGIWLVVGLMVYFAYGYKHSKLGQEVS